MAEQMSLFETDAQVQTQDNWKCAEPGCTHRRLKWREWCESHLVRDEYCRHPEYSASWASNAGKCRCSRCVDYLLRTQSKKSKLCRVPGCTNERVFKKSQCSEHYSPRVCVVPGCTVTIANGRNKKCLIHYGGIVEVECYSCGRVARGRPQRGAYFCSICTDRNVTFVKTARLHQVDDDTIRRWLQDMHCSLCGAKLKLNSKSPAHRPQIDHDHACCPGQKGCSKCVRGILCMACNLRLGHVEALLRDNSALMAKIDAYLRRDAA